MGERIVFCLVDAMRQDAMFENGHAFLPDLCNKSSYSLYCEGDFRAVSLPNMTSIFVSQPAAEHGVLTNFPQTPQAPTIFNVVAQAGRRCALFGSFQALENLARPGELHCAMHFPSHGASWLNQLESEKRLTHETAKYMRENQPDFVWHYMGFPDEAGHMYGHMSCRYLQSVYNASECIEMLYNEFGDDYTFIITADHGGHSYTHGTGLHEDQFVPLICHGQKFKPGYCFPRVSGLDIAPTIIRLLGLDVPPQWRGKNLLEGENQQ